jgi:hypothetical protein
MMSGVGCALFEFPERGEVRVVLDFRHRDRLDALTCPDQGRLPRVATIHPADAHAFEFDKTDSTFFDVRPANWNEEHVLSLLRSVQDVEIAILPELSLPDPESLQSAIGIEAEALPPLIVAGSAHHRRHASPEVRVNESRIYFEGECVAIAHKVHPFATNRLGDLEFEQALTEDLSSEQKTITVLAGEKTRLAVVICADLNDRAIPSILISACVNLLLVPAFTEKLGAFNGAATDLASRCQGLTVIANARLREDGQPFICLTAVPRPEPENQSRAPRGPLRSPPAEVTLVDPNVELSDAFSWP